MILGNKLEEKIYDPEHIREVLAEISSNFPSYFTAFARKRPEHAFVQALDAWEGEEEPYRDYLDLRALEEYEYDPNAFKSDTRRHCPIIHRCLMSQDERMKAYKKSFNRVTGRQLLDTMRNIAQFGRTYAAAFDDAAHERATSYADLALESLNESQYGAVGVVGYGVQSTLLFGLYPRQFAHRSQNAVWSLYFLSGGKHFGLRDGNEFLIAEPKEGTCEQNYFYRAELFGFYALKLYLLLKAACAEQLSIPLQAQHRYIYLNAFCDHVADMHRDDINTFTRNSEHVESLPRF